MYVQVALSQMIIDISTALLKRITYSIQLGLAACCCQDTVVAMQALVAYAERDTNRALYSMLVDIRPSATTGAQRQVQLTKGNFAQNFDVTVRSRYYYAYFCYMSFSSKSHNYRALHKNVQRHNVPWFGTYC